MNLKVGRLSEFAFRILRASVRHSDDVTEVRNTRLINVGQEGADRAGFASQEWAKPGRLLAKGEDRALSGRGP
jgi:hypothetical protein